jgi:hypothetical protein
MWSQFARFFNGQPSSDTPEPECLAAVGRLALATARTNETSRDFSRNQWPSKIERGAVERVDLIDIGRSVFVTCCKERHSEALWPRHQNVINRYYLRSSWVRFLPKA